MAIRREHVSRGALQLRDRIRERYHGKGGQAQAARDLLVSQSTISLLVAGKRRPGPELMADIKTVLGIPEDAWTS